MHKSNTLLAAAALTLLLPGASAAGRLSWFDETPERDTLGRIRTPLASVDGDARRTFGIEAYRSFESMRLLEDYGLGKAMDTGDEAVVKLYGEISPRADRFYVPPAVLSSPGIGGLPLLIDPSDRRLSGFGIKLQHRLDAANTIAIAAGYSEVPWSAEAPHLEVLDTRAAVSWRGTWAGEWRPGVTGSVFVGDESVREEPYHQLGRRYYGFSLGGELRLAQHHTPYFSYRLRRNMHAPDDPALALGPYDDQSQISAGWRWQVQPNWSLQAEARYGLNGAHLDPYSPDRSRVFFGTRFDFR